ncbi:MAG: 23S rRNA (adenine(2503)-C(2))-methyltransferase RlmN, partial [Schleiferiaceae bacterium]
MSTTKTDIRGLSQEALIAFFEKHGEKAFRAKQVYQWLWQKSAASFEEMTNLSKETRTLLDEHFEFKLLEVDLMQRSVDGTIKNAVKLHDGALVESVLIPTEKRITACVSSQVGCSLDCTFCATASLKRMRNLGPDEIYDQVVVIDRQGREFFGRPLTNIVFMGMGEPLLNYANVLSAIDKITDPKGLGLSPKRITLSTIGVPKLIKKMADDEVRFNLAISLHSAIEEKRSKLMPLAHRSATLADLRESLQYWYAKTGRGVTFEYVIWRGINDTEKD